MTALTGTEPLRERLCRQLTRSAKETERAAAELLPKLGQEITPSAAAKAIGWPKPLTAEALEELVDAQLLYSPTPGGYAYYGLVDLALPHLTAHTRVLFVRLPNHLRWR